MLTLTSYQYLQPARGTMGELLFKTKANGAAPWRGLHYHCRIFWHSLEGGCLMTFCLWSWLWIPPAQTWGIVCGSGVRSLTAWFNFSVWFLGGKANCWAPFKPFSWCISCQFVYRGYLIFQAYGLRSRRLLSCVDDQQMHSQEGLWISSENINPF